MSEPTLQTPDIDQPITFLRGVGQKQAEKLLRLEVHTVRDMLQHYPARWVDRRTVQPMQTLRDGLFGNMEEPEEDWVTVVGEVVGSRLAGRPRRWGKGPPQRLEVTLRDGSGSVSLVFFGGGWRKNHFTEG
ncbi:MAG: hypothetical protein HKN21_01080, partial [Candidatus Eisenbacteria bacterium]|nr:hypothetical protein [Candidatus Eisenbacteria bacterium]